MGSSLKLQLTEAELKAVREAMNHDPRPEVRQRATAIHLLHLNHKPADVAEMTAVTPATIYNWWQRWQRNGIEGLANRAKSGRPSNADARYIALLEQTLDTSPLDLGFDFPIWTINRLRHYLAEQTSILLSYTRFRALLNKLGFVYRQPKHDLTHLQDSEARGAARELLAWLKKTPETSPPGPSSASLWTKRR
jgi:transposase